MLLKLDDIPIVREFSNVFPEDLPGIPVDREIEFSFDVILEISPISKAPYQMAPTKLKEFNCMGHESSLRLTFVLGITS